MKTREQPHGFRDCPRCGAKTRAGTPCKAPAMKNGRCQMHGGKSTGPPKGNQNAFKHGFHTKDAIAERKRIRQLIKDSQALLQEV
jgi:uncharacterized protein YjcR